MPVEKPQVGFAARPVGLTGKVGTPILVVSAVLERACHQVVYYRGMGFQLSEVYRTQSLEVPLSTVSMELLAARCEGELRAALIPAFGAQMDLDLVDP